MSSTQNAEIAGHFEIVPATGPYDGEVYVAKCLRPDCDWVSGKSGSRAALVKLHGPVIQHQRDKHGYPPRKGE